MKITIKNPIKLLSQQRFTLPQILLTVVLVAGLAFAGGVVWRTQQKARLARESAAAQAESDRLAQLKSEAELNKATETTDKPAETPAPAPKPTPVPTPVVSKKPVLSLKGVKVTKGIQFTWEVANISVTKGYKLVGGKTANPVYPGNDASYISDPAARSYTWGLKDGKTYHFRICVYNGSGCSYYSNDITVTAPYVAPTPPSGSLALSAGAGSTVTWTLDGSAPYGYKLIWTPSPGTPSYPGGGSAAYHEKSATNGTISGDSGTTYNARICAYYEGTCGFYSNQIQITLP